MEIGDANFKVVVRGGPADDEFTEAIVGADRLLLMSGHGGSVIARGGTLPDADTWSIYAKAETAEEAEEMVTAAVKGLQRPRVIVSVEPIPEVSGLLEALLAEPHDCGWKLEALPGGEIRYTGAPGGGPLVLGDPPDGSKVQMTIAVDAVCADCSSTEERHAWEPESQRI